MEPSVVASVMTAIQTYLARHPHSADTLEGIHSWWIDWPDLPESVFITQLALERLETDGVLQSHAVANRQLWRLRQNDELA